MPRLLLKQMAVGFGERLHLAREARGQVAGIVVGVLLAGVLLGALGMLCWVKRRRLFPKR